MRQRGVAVFALGFLLLVQPAWAHRIDEYLQATMLSLNATRADASMRLIPGVLVASSVIGLIDSNHDGVFSQSETQAYVLRVLHELSITIDGQSATPKLDSYTIPESSQLREGLGEILIHYHVDLPPSSKPTRSLVLANHHLNVGSVYLVNVEIPRDPGLRVVDQQRNQLQSLYELDYRQTWVADTSSSWRINLQGWLRGLQFSILFHLGMRHIAEGTDHLLFLLVLLLPAPLLEVDSRWQRTAGVRRSLLRIAGIVTAFTVGHSLTLTLAAMNVVHVPSRPVEILIALSILISAIHALRPLFPGREAWIAAFFGLVHGLAFATTLDRLGLSRWDRVAGILAFNLGIETMQIIVVALILPSLLLMSWTRAYPILRIGGAVLACAASSAWIAERIWNVQTPVDAVADKIVRTGGRDAALLFALSLACVIFANKRKNPDSRFSPVRGD